VLEPSHFAIGRSWQWDWFQPDGTSLARLLDKHVADRLRFSKLMKSEISRKAARKNFAQRYFEKNEIGKCRNDVT
jgi:hypothetical protein